MIRSSPTSLKLWVLSRTQEDEHVLTNTSQWDGADKSQIQEKKIRVLWLPAFGEETTSPVAATPIRPSTSNRVRLPFAYPWRRIVQANHHMRRLRKPLLPSHPPARPDPRRPTLVRLSKSPTSPITSRTLLRRPQHQYRTRLPRRTSS